MKRLSIIMLLAALTLTYSCSEPDNTGSGAGQEQGGNQDDGNDNGNDGGDEVTTYKVGDYYKSGLAEGIVVAVDESGEHGYLISVDETRAQWSTEYQMLTVQGGEFSPTDGAWNCEYIRMQENWEELFPAFAWCHSKNILGLTAWYLPARDELAPIVAALDTINATLTEKGMTPISTAVNDYYWTSEELGAQGAYAFSFYEGDIASYDTNKLNEHLVRAMRKF